MPTVSGRVFFSPTRTLNTGSGIANVPIVLRDTTTGVGLTVLTNSTGNYTFNNVPAGNYTLVEAWGQGGGVASPADFNNATAISAATPDDPPVSAVTSPPSGTNRIDSISPNTVNITVSGNIIQNFTDTPVRDIPFVTNDLTLIGSNLITSANDGDWGTLPAGSPINSRPATEPYPGVSPNFTYSSAVPGGNQYTVSNITNGLNGSWWNMADHTSGDETGRLEVINGGPVGNSFFRQTVSINPNTYYLFSAWFANMVNVDGFPAGPGVRITTLSGTTIFTTAARNIPSSSSLLSWNQIGSLFNTGNNTAVIVNFIDVSGGFSGNDYAADDFSLTEAVPANILVGTTKSVDKASATIGDTLTYTVVINNSGVSTAEFIKILDTIPNGTSFQPGSVKINGVTFSTKNPSPPLGLTLPNIAGGGRTTLTFNVTVTTIPSPNPIPNSANLTYAYAPIVGSTTIPFSVNTNTVNTLVGNVNLGAINKTASENFGTNGDTITYTITFKNTGTNTATNVIFSDTIPVSTSYIANTLVVNGVTQTGLSPTPPGVTIPDVGPGQNVTITFNVLVTTTPTVNPIVNQSKVSYFAPSATTATNLLSNNAITTITFLQLTSSKIVDKAFANIGDILTYTIPIRNTGNITATNILFIDTIPSGTTLVANTLRQDGILILGVTLPNSIGVNRTTTVTFQVRITEIPNPNPIPNTASAASSFIIDSTTTPNRTGIASTNSNTVNTSVNFASLTGITKLTDKSFANCGEVITYTILAPNTGTVTAQNVLFRDTIPNGTVLVANSVTVNGVTQSGANPSVGVTIPNIAPGATATLTFQVRVTC